jgi:hypothetical protein
MTGRSLYCTIQDLELIESRDKLINLVADLSSRQITDYTVVRNLDGYIAGATKDFEGILRRYMTVPFIPTVTALTGTFTFNRGSEDADITGGDLEELPIYTEVRPDAFPDIRLIVKETGVDSGGNLVTFWDVFYHEFNLPGAAASKYEWFIPGEVREIIAGYTLWKLWERRQAGDNNPRLDRKVLYDSLVEQIKEGEFRFDREGELVHPKPSQSPEATSVYTETFLNEWNLGDH